MPAQRVRKSRTAEHQPAMNGSPDADRHQRSNRGHGTQIWRAWIDGHRHAASRLGRFVCTMRHVDHVSVIRSQFNSASPPMIRRRCARALRLAPGRPRYVASAAIAAIRRSTWEGETKWCLEMRSASWPSRGWSSTGRL